MVIIVNLPIEEDKQNSKYDSLAELVDEIFGRKRVSIVGREFQSSQKDSIYVDERKHAFGYFDAGVEISSRASTIIVRHESYFDQVMDFANRYEKMFNDELTVKLAYRSS